MTDTKTTNMINAFHTLFNFFEMEWNGLPLATLETEIKKAVSEGLHAGVDWKQVAKNIYDYCDEVEKQNSGMDRTHGSLYDTGKADSYYGRQKDPHYYVNQNGVVNCINDLSEIQIDEYNAGYDDNNAAGDFKDWG